MTIEYKDSKRIVALSTDIVETVDYENTSAVSLGTGDSGTSIDLTGSTLDNSWILRFKVTMTTIGTGNSLLFMVQDSTTTTATDARDGIGLRQTDSGSYYDFEGCDNISGKTGQYDHRFSTTTPATDTKYVQITRISATSAKIEFYDSTYSTVSESSGNITIANITNLRYFVISNNASVLTVDDIDLWNGVTELTSKPTNVQDNSLLVEKDTAKRYWFEDNIWTLPITRGVFGGGGTPSDSNVMDYITIATTGNATDFGDLTVARRGVNGVSSETRGVFGCGWTGSALNTMDYITIATLGDATDFGDLSVARSSGAGVSNLTRGVFGGGYAPARSNVMDYITISTTSNATDFGDLTVGRSDVGGVSSDTRGVFASGHNGSSFENVMDYITISTTGNATDFGDLTISVYNHHGVNSRTRGVFGGGYTGSLSNVMDYITIATTGNATDFGDLTLARDENASVTSYVRGVWAGGHDGTQTNVIDYITIDTIGNASDFGDLTVARRSNPGGVEA